jgi:hypothetical protein
MVFENGVKNIQAAAYNGARTVFQGFKYAQRYVRNWFQLLQCFFQFPKNLYLVVLMFVIQRLW